MLVWVSDGNFHSSLIMILKKWKRNNCLLRVPDPEKCVVCMTHVSLDRLTLVSHFPFECLWDDCWDYRESHFAFRKQTSPFFSQRVPGTDVPCVSHSQNTSRVRNHNKLQQAVSDALERKQLYLYQIQLQASGFQLQSTPSKDTPFVHQKSVRLERCVFTFNMGLYGALKVYERYLSGTFIFTYSCSVFYACAMHIRDRVRWDEKVLRCKKGKYREKSQSGTHVCLCFNAVYERWSEKCVNVSLEDVCLPLCKSLCSESVHSSGVCLERMCLKRSVCLEGVDYSFSLLLCKCLLRPSVCRRNGRKERRGIRMSDYDDSHHEEGRREGSIALFHYLGKCILWKMMFTPSEMHAQMYIHIYTQCSKLMRPEKQVHEDDDDGCAYGYMEEWVEAKTSSSVNLLLKEKTRRREGDESKRAHWLPGSRHDAFPNCIFSQRRRDRMDTTILFFSPNNSCWLLLLWSSLPASCPWQLFFAAALLHPRREPAPPAWISLASRKEKGREKTGLQLASQEERTDRRRRGPEKYSSEDREKSRMRRRLLLVSPPAPLPVDNSIKILPRLIFSRRLKTRQQKASQRERRLAQVMLYEPFSLILSFEKWTTKQFTQVWP